jgi:hypothetical protein
MRMKAITSYCLNNIVNFLFFQPCDTSLDFRSDQCSNYDNVPYKDQLLKWYPYFDQSRPCALICRGEQFNNHKYNKNNNNHDKRNNNVAISSLSDPVNEQLRTLKERLQTNAQEYESDESIIVQLADKVEDGTNCYPNAQDVCINGECMVSESTFYFIFTIRFGDI